MIVRLSDMRRRRAVELFEAGAPYCEIAGELGITVGALAQWLNRHGYRRKAARKQNDPETTRRAVELRKAGKSYRQISAETGIYFNALRKLFKQHGLSQSQTRRAISAPLFNPVSLLYEPMPVFPAEDDFRLKPEHRARLEQVRRARIEAWKQIHGGQGNCNY